MLHKRHNHPFIAAIDDNDIVWELAKNETFFSLATGPTRHGRERTGTIFYHINGSLDHLHVLGYEALPPCSCQAAAARVRLFDALAENSNLRHYRGNPGRFNRRLRMLSVSRSAARQT